MELLEIENNHKWDYRDLLLLADEQEDMVARYLDKGRMFVLSENGETLGEAVVVDLGTTEDGHTFELKSLATREDLHGKGYGKKLVRLIMDLYRDQGDYLLVGTGESDLTLPFYYKCGFEDHHRLKDFFTKNYDHPIYENGVLLRDMIYLGQKL